jgi:hypothetical protein
VSPCSYPLMKRSDARERSQGRRPDAPGQYRQAAGQHRRPVARRARRGEPACGLRTLPRAATGLRGAGQWPSICRCPHVLRRALPDRRRVALRDYALPATPLPRDNPRPGFQGDSREFLGSTPPPVGLIQRRVAIGIEASAGRDSSSSSTSPNARHIVGRLGNPDVIGRQRLRLSRLGLVGRFRRATIEP